MANKKQIGKKLMYYDRLDCYNTRVKIKAVKYKGKIYLIDVKELNDG